MKKFLLFLVSLLIGVILFIWIIQRIGLEEIKLAFFTFSGPDGLAILGLTLLMLIVGNWRWKEILKNQGNNLSFLSLFRLYLAGFSILFFAPMIIFGGETFRAYLLKEKYSIPWNKGMASVIVDRVIELTIYILIILTGVIFLFSYRGLPPGYLAMILGGTLVFFIVMIGLFYFKSFKKQSVFKFFGKLFNPKIDDGEPFEVEKEFIKLLKPKKTFFWKIVGLSCLKCGLALTRAWFLILSLGKVISFLPALSILSFSYLAILIPIPAALGTHEAFQTLTFNNLDLGASIAPVFTMVIRIAELTLALIGAFILFRLGAGLLGSILFRKIENLINNKR